MLPPISARDTAAALVNELGDDAETICKIRIVELVAADNRAAETFWRDVLAELRALPPRATIH